MREIILYGLAAAFAAMCAYTDWKYHKIWNKWTFPAMGLGLGLNGLFCGLPGILNSALGILAGYAAILFFILGVLKAGDVKLYMAVGALLGWKMFLWAAALSVLAGGAAGIVLMVLRKTGRSRFKRLWM